MTELIHEMCGLQTKLTIQQKFRFLEISKLQVPKGTAHYDPIQGTARLVIVLVSRIQKSGTGYSNLANGKEPSWPIKLDHLQSQSIYTFIFVLCALMNICYRVFNSPFSHRPRCILFSNFSWVLQSSQDKSKTMVVQNVGG